MSYCLAPLNNNFSINGTCCQKSIPKSKLILCQFHYDLLVNSKKEHPRKTFPPTKICLICKTKNNTNYYKNGICSHCIPSIESSHLNISLLLKMFSNSPNLYRLCDIKIKKLLNQFIVELDDTLPSIFQVIIYENSVKIIDEYSYPLRIIEFDKEDYFTFSFYKNNKLVTVFD